MTLAPFGCSFDLDELEVEDRPQRSKTREKFVNNITLYGTVGRKPEEYGLEGIVHVTTYTC